MEKERLYSEIIDTIGSGIYFVDTEKQITFWNKGAEKISGYCKEEVLGLKCQDTKLEHIDKNGNLLCRTGCPLYATIIDGVERNAEVFLRHKEGHRVPIKVDIYPLQDGGEIVGAIEIFHQSSPAVYDDKLMRELADNASNDALTGLPNRRNLQSFLEFRISEFKRFGRKFCVIFLDIDNFGSFNKTFGHAIGDLVLKSISSTIMGTVRSTDIFGRWGGEEFVGIFGIKEDYEASLVAEKIRMLIENTTVDPSIEDLENADPPEGSKLSVTASLGCTVINEDDNVLSIVNRADAAMRGSKFRGKNKVSFVG